MSIPGQDAGFWGWFAIAVNAVEIGGMVYLGVKQDRLLSKIQEDIEVDKDRAQGADNLPKG